VDLPDVDQPTGIPWRIRRAGADDLEPIVAISNRAAAETIANFAIEPEPVDGWRARFEAQRAMHPWLVVEAGPVDDGGERILGFARSGPWLGRGAYAFSAEVSVYLRPEATGRGLGRALYDRLFAILRAQGRRSLLAGIALPNPASVALHERMGMRRVSLLRAVGWKFGRWHDVGYWQVLWDAEGGVIHPGDHRTNDELGPPRPLRTVDEALAGLDERP